MSLMAWALCYVVADGQTKCVTNSLGRSMDIDPNFQKVKELRCLQFAFDGK